MYNNDFEEKRFNIWRFLLTILLFFLTSYGGIITIVAYVFLFILPLSWTISKKSSSGLKRFGIIVFIIVLIGLIYGISTWYMLYRLATEN